MLNGNIFEKGNQTCMSTSASFSSRSLLLRGRHITSFLRIVTLCLLLLLVGYELFHHLLPSHAQYQPVRSTVFLHTDTPTFELRASPTSGSISYTVTGSSGTTVARGQIAAAGSQTTLTLPRLPDDYYVLQVTRRTGST